jgi:hypothetical protein
VDGQPVAVAGGVADGVALVVFACEGAFWAFELKSERRKKLFHPPTAQGGAVGVGGGQVLDFFRKMLPIQLDAAPSVFDLAAEVGPPLKAKVGGGLSGGFPVCDPLEYFFGQKIALYVEGGVFHGFGFFGKKRLFGNGFFGKKRVWEKSGFLGKNYFLGEKRFVKRIFWEKGRKKSFQKPIFFLKKLKIK